MNEMMPNNLSKEVERESFVNEQKTRADKRNELRTYPDKWLSRNKVDYVTMAEEEAYKMDELAKSEISLGRAKTYQEAIEKLMHLEDFQLKNEKQIISEENWTNLPVESVYSKAKDPKTEIPTFLMPGWANTPGITFNDCIKKLNEKGRDVLSVETTRTMEILATGDEKHPKVEIQKAMAILKVLEEKGVEKTDLLLHSEAGINGLIAASMQPEKFRKIIMAMPAGIIGKDSFWNLVGRFSKELFAGTINLVKDPKRIMPTNKYIFDLLKYLSKNPSLALKEVIAIANSDISYMIKNLEEQGIEIEIIAAKNDPVYAPKEIKKNNPDIEDKIHELDGIASHGEIFMDSDKVMQTVDDLLEKK